LSFVFVVLSCLYPVQPALIKIKKHLFAFLAKASLFGFDTPGVFTSMGIFVPHDRQHFPQQIDSSPPDYSRPAMAHDPAGRFPVGRGETMNVAMATGRFRREGTPGESFGGIGDECFAIGAQDGWFTSPEPARQYFSGPWHRYPRMMVPAVDLGHQAQDTDIPTGLARKGISFAVHVRCFRKKSWDG